MLTFCLLSRAWQRAPIYPVYPACRSLGSQIAPTLASTRGRIEFSQVSIEALCAAPPEAPSLQVGPVAAEGVGHLRKVRHLLV